MATMRTELGTTCAACWTLEWIERVKEGKRSGGGDVRFAGRTCRTTRRAPGRRTTRRAGARITAATISPAGPEGNRNAVIHGLYSRRLLICGDHCPRWFSCPYASPDLLEIPLKNRPNCVYEQVEYDTLTGTTSPDWEGTHGQEHGPARTHTGCGDDGGREARGGCSVLGNLGTRSRAGDGALNASPDFWTPLLVRPTKLGLRRHM